MREAITDANAYYADNESYTGMTPPSLVANYDSGLKVSNGDSTGIVSIKPGQRAGVLHLGRVGRPLGALQRARRQGGLRPEHG